MSDWSDWSDWSDGCQQKSDGDEEDDEDDDDIWKTGNLSLPRDPPTGAFMSEQSQGFCFCLHWCTFSFLTGHTGLGRVWNGSEVLRQAVPLSVPPSLHPSLWSD